MRGWLRLTSTPAWAQITNFSQDVNTAIDRGLAYLDTNSVFQNPSSAGEGAGLAALSLLERRESADPNSPPVGYANALPADKVRIDAVIDFIIERATAEFSFFGAYRDGADLMALAVYARTVPQPLPADPMDPVAVRFERARAAIDALFDRIAAAQGMHGYWCYTDGSCLDSSTTQLVMAGLAAARGVFGSPDIGDPARLAQLNTLTAATRQAYVTNGLVGELEETEKGHGYNAGVGNPLSLQQTASGLWGQVIGGADVNDASVQSYLRWIRNRYAYDTISSANGGWSASHQYFLWS